MADKGKGKGGKKGGNKKEKNKKPDSPVDSDTPQAAEPKLKALRSVEVQEGKKAILRCEVIAGQPIANFKWYKNGKELAGKNKPKDVKIKNKKNKKSSELHFRKTAESNAGSYTCEAINDHGKDTAVGDLTVIKDE